MQTSTCHTPQAHRGYRHPRWGKPAFVHMQPQFVKGPARNCPAPGAVPSTAWEAQDWARKQVTDVFLLLLWLASLLLWLASLLLFLPTVCRHAVLPYLVWTFSTLLCRHKRVCICAPTARHPATHASA